MCDDSYDVGGANGFTPGPDLFNGNDLIRESGDKVIVVVIQYRLGLFGFLAGASVKVHGALNAGLCGFLIPISAVTLTLISMRQWISNLRFNGYRNM